jgi:hypothetical protein
MQSLKSSASWCTRIPIWVCRCQTSNLITCWKTANGNKECSCFSPRIIGNASDTCIIMYSSAHHCHLNNCLFCFMMVSQSRLFSIEWQVTGESRIGKHGSSHSLITVLLPGWTEENHEKIESGYLVSGQDSHWEPPEYKPKNCLKTRWLENYAWMWMGRNTGCVISQLNAAHLVGAHILGN